MNCSKIKKLLNLYIDDSLDSESTRQIEQHLKSCPACRQEYESLRNLVNTLNSFATAPQTVPADFTTNLMAKISQEDLEIQTSFWVCLRKRFFIPGWSFLRFTLSFPRKLESIFSFRLLGIAIAVAAVVVVFFASTSIFNQPNTSSMCYAEVQFSLRLADHQAHTVAIAGDFNGWNTQANLLKYAEEDGVWIGILKLEPGRYEYMFVIDGEKWLPDPNAFSYVKDGFGNKNAVLKINNCQNS